MPFCLFIELNLKRSFDLCSRLYVNVIWSIKCMKIRKLIWVYDTIHLHIAL